VADVTEIELESRAYDLWHDRAVFHFLTEPKQRSSYVRQVIRAVKPGGHVIVGTFGPEGPTKCSGLEVMRYEAESLHEEFGARFRVESSKEQHHTPSGTTQQG
jgi:Methyltransferase domain